MDDFDKLPTIITVAETARVLRMGLGSTYTALRRGEIPSKRIGGRILISKNCLISFLSGAASVGASNGRLGMETA